MSYCEIITFENGKPKDSIQYDNSWGGAAFIWSSLFDRYLKDPEISYDNWLMPNNQKKLWDFPNHDNHPLFERAVLVATFDWAIVRSKNYKQFILHLQKFVKKYHIDDKVCHLLEWGKFILSCEAEAIGFHGTSVSENLWYSYNEEKDESIPYDLNTQDKHIEVYDYLSNLQKSVELK